MPSSISSSEVPPFVRIVPRLRWRAAGLLALALVVIAVSGWELRMRSLGLHAADIGDGKAYWVVERRKIDAGPRDQVAILGDSRILFDTNLDVWQQLTGIRPIQLALAGTPALPFLTDLANDEHFAGLVVLGMNEPVFFLPVPGIQGDALEYSRIESPSQRVGHQIDLLLQRRLAFLDAEYALFSLIDQLDLSNRLGVDPGYFVAGNDYLAVWKLAESFADRQTTMWPRFETDAYLQRHAELAWSSTITLLDDTFAHGAPYPDALIGGMIAKARRDIETIRGRGGEVVFVRPPASGEFLKWERIAVPRATVWERLLRETHSFGIHFEDYPEMRVLVPREWSHLTGADQKLFTRAYVTVLCQKVAWLQAHAANCAGNLPADKPVGTAAPSADPQSRRSGSP
jgi:hypothetical protein